jgi:N-acetyldiaminopimelate deacetylase
MSSPDLNLFEVRRQLHRIPELAFQEIRTQDLLLQYLKDLPGIRIHQFKQSTGILVEYSHGIGAYLLIRADMDALPIAETTGCDFASQNEGMMHACGHDIHMTVLLGLIYKVIENNYRQNLLFLFQPAEEGLGGAESILQEGLLQSFEIKAALALHVSGRLPVGTVSSKAGIFFAIPQEFDVEFTGQAAHAAFPEQGKNALLGGLEFCRRIHGYIKQLQNSEQVIFNIGVLNSGTIRNIIPDKCLLQGTQRTLTKANRDLINTEIKSLAGSIAAEFGLQQKVDLLCTYDAVVNDGGLCEQLKAVCQTLRLEFRESKTFMTGEDFGFFTSVYPGLLFWLGGGEQPYDLHSDRFLPDESCIPVGISVFIKMLELIK